MTGSATPITLTAHDPLAVHLTAAIESGALHKLSLLLDEHPGLANARIAARRKTWRTPLHVVTHWPGYFPNGPAVVGLLINAGADPSAPSAEGPSETPLHWAASNDDVDVAAALIDGGADIEAPGASIAGEARSAMLSATAAGTWPAFSWRGAPPSTSCGWLPPSASTSRSKLPSRPTLRPRRASTRLSGRPAMVASCAWRSCC
ncbi:MAG: ankyrin repeat domain-containing protein, partial [Acidimicrobiales bacterium]